MFNYSTSGKSIEKSVKLFFERFSTVSVTNNIFFLRKVFVLIWIFSSVKRIALYVKHAYLNLVLNTVGLTANTVGSYSNIGGIMILDYLFPFSNGFV